jgi:hypothetical protein
MPGQILTVVTQIQCQHGGVATVVSKNVHVKVAGAFALIEGDIHMVAGCPFTVGTKYSPCVRIEWSAGAAKASAGAPLLVPSSVGKCFSAENALQGVAIIGSPQPKGSAQ